WPQALPSRSSPEPRCLHRTRRRAPDPVGRILSPMGDSRMPRASSSNTESALLLGVVRSEGQLLAVVSRRRMAGGAAALPAGAAGRYAVTSVPVGAVDQGLLAEKTRLC